MKKVLLINGSPHNKGCTFTALNEVAETLKKDGIATEIYHIGTKPVRGCIACFTCMETGKCAFNDDAANEMADKIKEADGVILGSPVYFAGPNGALCALLDRVFMFCKPVLMGKVGASVVSCRRGGATATFDRLNKYFGSSSVHIIESQYWNCVHGMTPEDVKKDTEGMQTMRTLGQNMAWVLQNIEKGGIALPKLEEPVMTNFIK